MTVGSSAEDRQLNKLEKNFGKIEIRNYDPRNPRMEAISLEEQMIYQKYIARFDVKYPSANVYAYAITEQLHERYQLPDDHRWHIDAFGENYLERFKSHWKSETPVKEACRILMSNSPLLN
jgi:hypothetical protein